MNFEVQGTDKDSFATPASMTFEVKSQAAIEATVPLVTNIVATPSTHHDDDVKITFSVSDVGQLNYVVRSFERPAPTVDEIKNA